MLPETRQVACRAQARGIEKMLRILKGLSSRFEVCYEPGCCYGHFHDLLRQPAAGVAVVHAGG